MGSDEVSLANEIKSYLNTNPFASTLGTSRYFKLTRAELCNFCRKVGITLPKPMSCSARSTLSRKQNKLFDGWTINKPSLNRG